MLCTLTLVKRFALLLLVIGGPACSARPDPNCGQPSGCAADELCVFSAAYGFLEDGNPNLINTDSYSCVPLPERCSVSTCECLECRGEFACDAGPSCTCGIGGACSDGPHGAIVTAFKE